MATHWPLTAGEVADRLVDVLDDDAHLAQFLVGDLAASP
jgi:hypothetical protein